MAILILTHTRTALAALVAGLLVAGLSLFTINARVRKFFAVGVHRRVDRGHHGVRRDNHLAGARPEHTAGLTGLTGRTDFWQLVLDLPRTRFQEIFGFGLSNASINGLPIDSNWLSAYMQEGLFGVVVCAVILLLLIRGRLLPATRRTARARPVPRHVLHGVLIHRGLLHQRLRRTLLHLTMAASARCSSRPSRDGRSSPHPGIPRQTRGLAGHHPVQPGARQRTLPSTSSYGSFRAGPVSARRTSREEPPEEPGCVLGIIVAH